MILLMIAVRDHKTAQFANPMFLITKAHAIRTFADAVNEKSENNQLNLHPEDFEIFQIGTYDTDTGEVTPTKPTSLATAAELVAQR